MILLYTTGFPSAVGSVLGCFPGARGDGALTGQAEDLTRLPSIAPSAGRFSALQL